MSPSTRTTRRSSRSPSTSAMPNRREAFAKVWPLAKFPVIRDEARGQTVAEATVIIEYLDAFYPGPTRFIPADPDLAWQTRMWDRVFDHLRPRADAEARRRPHAAGRQERSARRRAGGDDASARSYATRRPARSAPGHGRWATASRSSTAPRPRPFPTPTTLVPFDKHLKNLARLSRPPDRTAVFRAGAEGGRTVLPVLSGRDEAATRKERGGIGRRNPLIHGRRHDRSVLDGDGAVHLGGERVIVGGDQRREPRFAHELAERFEYVGGRLRVEVAGRLIGEQ